MTPEERITKLEAQVKEMESYILGLTGNLNYKNTVGTFSKEAVIQQIVTVDVDNPDSEIVNAISISGEPQSINVLDFPDFFVYLRDKNNVIYKVPAYTITL